MRWKLQGLKFDCRALLHAEVFIKLVHLIDHLDLRVFSRIVLVSRHQFSVLYYFGRQVIKQIRSKHIPVNFYIVSKLLSGRYFSSCVLVNISKSHFMDDMIDSLFFLGKHEILKFFVVIDLLFNSLLALGSELTPQVRC